MSRPSFYRERAIIHQLIARWGTRQLVALHVEDGDIWMAELRARVKPATVNRHLVRIKHLFATAARWRYVTVNPVAHLRKLREPRGRTRYLQPGQLETLIKTAPDWLRAYIVVARFAPAGRRSNIWTLRRSDLDLTSRTITFRATKNGDDLTIPLHPRVLAILSPLPDEPAAHLLRQVALPHITYAFTQLCARIGLVDFHFHDLRHDAVDPRLGR